MAELAPIALFVYNRLEHTRLTIDALLRNSQASQSELFVFSDAAKTSIHEPAVAQVREYIQTISGFKRVSIIERDENWGLAKSIIDGVTKLCNEYGRAIVLEDDLVVSPHFLDFMNTSLLKYADEDRVMQIAGYMFPVELNTSEQALFLPLTSSWGWATWQRAWQHFDEEGTGFLRLQNDASMRRAFDLEGKYSFYKMLRSQQQGDVDSWAIRWYLTVFIFKGLVLYPKKSLIENKGFDGTGVNCVASGFDETPVDKAFLVEVFPEQVKQSPLFGEIIAKLPKPKLNIKAYFRRVTRLFRIS